MMVSVAPFCEFCEFFAAEEKHTVHELSSSCCSSDLLLQYQENPHCQNL